MINEYRSYNHVEKLESPDVEGLLNGIVTISPKLDGTNSCVWLSDGEFKAGSRKRPTTPDDDNAGFANWWANPDTNEKRTLRQVLTDNPSCIIYGEWLGVSKFVGQIKSYDPTALAHLWIFDVYDTETGRYLDEAEWRDLLDFYWSAVNLKKAYYPYYVPYEILENPTIEEIMEKAECNTFLMKNGTIGEGVVIRRADYLNKYGRYEIGKYVRPQYKQDKSKSKKVVPAGATEKEIVQYCVTDEECGKAVSKIENALNESFSTKSNKHIGMFLQMVWKDAVLDEIATICKKWKNPKIDFAALQREAFNAGRAYLKLQWR